MRATKAAVLTFSLLISGLIQISPSVAEEKLRMWEPCSITNSAPCIESLAYINEAGVRVQGKLSGRTRAAARSISLKEYQFTDYEWSLPGLKQENGNDRMLIAVWYFPKNFPYCWLENQDLKTCDYSKDEINFDLTPTWWDSQPPATKFENLERNDICGTREAPSVCIGGWSLNNNVSYEVIARLPKNFDPRMVVGEGTTGTTEFYRNKDGDRVFKITTKPSNRSIVWSTFQRPISHKNAEKADLTGNFLNFNIYSSVSYEPKWFSRCDNGAGLSIWHNSLERSNPYWIAEEKSMALDVSGVHRRMDGSINQGTFQIQMPVSVAQCMWGVDLSKASSVTVSSVYNEEGKSEVVTATSKTIDGIYYLTANGFHYSSPTIKVKLAQEAVVEQKVTPKTSAVPAKKVTISCVKSGKIKKVTAIKPKCPTGYKKTG